jgi:hypothetical protein
MGSRHPGYAHATYTALFVAFLIGWISSYILETSTYNSSSTDPTTEQKKQELEAEETASLNKAVVPWTQADAAGGGEETIIGSSGSAGSADAAIDAMGSSVAAAKSSEAVAGSAVETLMNIRYSMLEPLMMLAIGATVLALMHAFVFPTILGNDNEAVLFCGLHLMLPHIKLCLWHFLDKLAVAFLLVSLVCAPILLFTVPADKFALCVLWSILFLVTASFASG